MEIGVWTGLGSVGFGEKTHLIEKKRHFGSKRKSCGKREWWNWGDGDGVRLPVYR
jgi:hypothetical protein